jgi:hypothetical protein
VLAEVREREAWIESSLSVMTAAMVYGWEWHAMLDALEKMDVRPGRFDRTWNGWGGLSGGRRLDCGRW